MKTLTPEQRKEGFVRLIGRNKDGHLWSFLAGIAYAEEVLGEEPKVPFVRLTDEEKNVLFNRVVMEGLTMMQFVDAVENQLVEKNT